MKEHPILFSAPMVRAILEGRKTMTRRVAKLNVAGRLGRLSNQWHPDNPGAVAVCPYGQAGDRLWVRETFGYEFDAPLGVNAPPSRVIYRADLAHDALVGWVPSIHMPRCASRITLEVTGVRVERLQDISEEQARAEGVAEWARGALSPAGQSELSAIGQFGMLWEQINGAGSWDANPLVWVVEFKRIEATA